MSENEALLREMFAKLAVVEERTRGLAAIESRIASLEHSRARLLGFASAIGGVAGGLVTALRERLL